jgi:outer membrane factor, OMF family
MQESVKQVKNIIAGVLLTFLCWPACLSQSRAADSNRPPGEPPLRPAITSGAAAPSGRIDAGQSGKTQASGPVNKLEALAERALESEGAIFLDQNQIAVKAPLLTALIELHKEQSPYGIDAAGERPITLRDVLVTELANNLNIKISEAGVQSGLWLFRSSLGNFLPTLSNGFNYQTIAGKYASPFGMLSNVRSPYLTAPTNLNWTFFSGGANYYGASQAMHNYKSAKYELARNTNDMLMEGAHLYYQLVLQDVLLQIRIKALETSQALLEKNRIQYQFGANTQLDLYQAETQLARDQQSLINQQIARRKAAVALATNLNLNASLDLLVTDRVVSPVRLVDDKSKMADLVQIAIDNRPELKKWEQQRLAAKDAIKVAFAPLLPQVVGTANLATTGSKVSSSAASTGTSSAGTGSFATGGFSTSSVVTTGAAGNKTEFNLAEIFMIGIGIQWNLGGLGLTDAAKVQSARWQARQAQLEFARELTYVCRSVRDEYLDSLDAENLISATSAEVKSSRQQLKVAIIRFDEGVGTALDIVNAQRDYTQALINKANAIIQFNEAQVKLLRALGQISLDNLLANKPIFYKR